MNALVLRFGLLLPLAAALCAGAAENAGQTNAASLHPLLEPLRPLLGKTWKGTFKNSTPEKPVVDVMKWERALNGQAVRLLHSINDGAYGGETLIVPDAKKQGVVYYYFTTGGFMTTGTMEFKDGKIQTFEKVQGSASGVTEVKGESGLLPDGKFRVKTEHLKDGQWQAGRETDYEADPKAEVRFR